MVGSLLCTGDISVSAGTAAELMNSLGAVNVGLAVAYPLVRVAEPLPLEPSWGPSLFILHLLHALQPQPVSLLRRAELLNTATGLGEPLSAAKSRVIPFAGSSSPLELQTDSPSIPQAGQDGSTHCIQRRALRPLRTGAGRLHLGALPSFHSSAPSRSTSSGLSARSARPTRDSRRTALQGCSSSVADSRTSTEDSQRRRVGLRPDGRDE